MAMKTVLRNATVFRFDGYRHVPVKTDVYFDSHIQGFSESHPSDSGYIEHNMRGRIIGPGFIDTHCHGGGSGLNSTEGRYNPATEMIEGGADEEVLAGILRAHAKHGTTTMFLSSLAAPEDRIRRFIGAAEKLYGKPGSERGGAEFGGIDCEGTFLCPSDDGAYVGCLDPKYMHPASVGRFKGIFGDAEKMVKKVGIGFDWDSYSPESDPVGLAEYLVERGIMPCTGHSGASMKQVMCAIKAAGSMVFIHYGNGPNKSNLKPGFEGTMEAIPFAAGMDKEVYNIYAEHILDGVHVSPSFSAFAYGLFGPDRLIGVTDNIGISGDYDIKRIKLGAVTAQIGQHDKRALWKEGCEGKTLVGSRATCNDLFRYAMGLLTSHMDPKNIYAMYTCEKFGPFPRDEALSSCFKMLCSNPAKAYGLSDRGEISAGKRADLIALGSDNNVERVWVGGNLI